MNKGVRVYRSFYSKFLVSLFDFVNNVNTLSSSVSFIYDFVHLLSTKRILF